MKSNVGTVDKIVRYAVSALLVVLAFTAFPVTKGNGVGILFVVLAAVFTATALISWCPIWAAVRVNTKGAK